MSVSRTAHAPARSGIRSDLARLVEVEEVNAIGELQGGRGEIMIKQFPNVGILRFQKPIQF
jgi:hypothetical protein